MKPCGGIFLFPMLFFFTLGLQAKSPTENIFRYPLSPHTQDAFVVTCANLSEHPVVKGSFEQEKVLSRLGRFLKSSGNFIIAAGHGMVWDTKKPFPSTLALGKDYLVQARPGGQKTILSAAENETFIRIAEVISAGFFGRSRELLDNFEVFYSGAPAAWELGLLPIDIAITSFADRITMAGDSAIRSITVYEQNGDSIKYFLQKHNYPLEFGVHEKTLFSLP